MDVKALELPDSTSLRSDLPDAAPVIKAEPRSKVAIFTNYSIDEIFSSSQVQGVMAILKRLLRFIAANGIEALTLPHLRNRITLGEGQEHITEISRAGTGLHNCCRPVREGEAGPVSTRAFELRDPGSSTHVRDHLN